MFLNTELFNILNIYFFENVIFFFDKLTVFNEINDILFIFFYSFFINKTLILLKDDFNKKNGLNLNNNNKLKNSLFVSLKSVFKSTKFKLL